MSDQPFVFTSDSKTCAWCGKDCGGTCLGLTQSTQMKFDDPAYWMLEGPRRIAPTIYKEGCYICEDPEFAQMGLPLCYPCPRCGEHIAADEGECNEECGWVGGQS